MLWLLLLIAVLLGIYKYIWKPSRYWKDRGVVHKQPIPLLGNMARVILKRTSFYESIIEIYNEFPNERYNGVFQFNKPALLIRDLDLIKQMGITHFDHFMDRREAGSETHDILIGKNVFFLNGQKWKEMRATLSPAFTAGKMKAMFRLISECAEQMTNYFELQNKGAIEVEMKDLFTRYTNDVIATCAFGVKCDSLKEPKNTFYLMGIALTDFTGILGLKYMIANFMPKVFKFLKVNLFPKHLTKFFVNIIKETIHHRLNYGVIRPDMIHLLLEARKGKLKHEDMHVVDKGFAVIEESDIGKQKNVTTMELTDIDIAAQSFFFYLAAFETSSTLLSFMAIELAINFEVQERLYYEIQNAMKKCNYKPTYDAIMKMKYMDMVVSESLRKWAPGFSTVHVCTKEFTIKAVNPGEKDYTISVGESIIIPILGLHRNENYYPNPDRFDPERFSDANKASIIPYTYLPFGLGPRACIGSRFALLEVKLLFVHILTKFELKVTKQTCVPIKVSPKSIKIGPANGFWLKLTPRT